MPKIIKRDWRGDPALRFRYAGDFIVVLLFRRGDLLALQAGANGKNFYATQLIQVFGISVPTQPAPQADESSGSQWSYRRYGHPRWIA
jgi:hypothetical protein